MVSDVKSGGMSVSRSEIDQRPRSPGRTPAAEIESRQTHLIDVATAEFLTHGYEGASMSRIARTARASPKTVYARYAGKDELLLAVVDSLLSGSHDNFARELADGTAEVDKVLVACAMTLARHWLSEREIGLFRLVITEAVRFPQLATLYENSVEPFARMFEAYLDDQQTRGVLVIDNIQAAARLFTFVTTGPLRQMTLFGRSPSVLQVEEIVTRGVRLFLDGYRAS
jgi:AcrR family transcriptional regulator